jgi:hypothetical protein
LATVRSRRFGLKPVEKAEAELSGCLKITSLFQFIDTADWREPIIIERPIDHSHITLRETLREILEVQNSPEGPPRFPFL